MSETPKLTKKDFTSDQEIKWCPGCGDYAILAAAQMAMAKIGIPPHQTAVISGIGCSSRFPYYMKTYGMHSIHGRAPGFVTGLKIQNPELSVWMITGDGDGLSIGGNHLAHLIRRNVDVNVILFNNEIYGLTKGQYSPTSGEGLKTKSTPYGSIDHSFSPYKFAMGAGSTFFARTMDTDPKHMIEIFQKAHAHKGTSIIEVLQNCIIFNDKVHEKFTDRKQRDEHVIFLEKGKPLTYGKELERAVYLDDDYHISSDESTKVKKPLAHDPHNRSKALLLSELQDVLPMGVLYQNEKTSCYEGDLHQQVSEVKSTQTVKSMQELLHSGVTWSV